MLNPSNLTKRKKDIYLYLQQCIATKGYPPSVREIGEAVGLRSSSTVHRYLAELENDGFIIKDPSKPRAITLVSVDDDTNVIAKDIKTIALVGEVAAGSPILAVENIEETFAFSSSLIKGNDSFMLKVKGDSMINCGIFDGDYVIVKKQNTANNNDIVVALIDNEETTVKRFFKEKNTIRLQPENDFMEPIYTDNVSILGKVVSLFRYNIKNERKFSLT